MTACAVQRRAGRSALLLVAGVLLSTRGAHGAARSLGPGRVRAPFGALAASAVVGLSKHSGSARALGPCRARARRAPRAAPAAAVVDSAGELAGAAEPDLLAEHPYERPRQPWSYELTTDDGIALDARDLRERRSDWLRDLLSIGNSRILDALAERLVAVSLWSVLVTALVEADRAAPLGGSLHLAEALALPSWPLEAGSGLLAILLVFRTDQAYDRFWEARKCWAELQGCSRSIGLLALAHYPPGQARDLLLGYAATFPFALKQHLRGVRDLSRLQEAFLPYAGPWLGEAEARAELQRWLDEDSLPAALLEALSAEVGLLLRPRLPRNFRVAAADAQGQRQGALWSQLHAHVEALSGATSACERLKLTPIPWAYARHTSRYCTLFLLALPFALDDSGLPAWSRPLVGLGFGYVLYGLEEIGHLIEEPFSVAYARGPAGPGDGRLPLVRLCADGLVGGVRAGFGLLRAGLGVIETADELRRRGAALEVLPLRKYCYAAAHDLANLAAMRAGRELRAAEGAGGARTRFASAARSAAPRGADGAAEPAPRHARGEPWLMRARASSLTDHPARYRRIAAAAKQRLELIGDRRL